MDIPAWLIFLLPLLLIWASFAGAVVLRVAINCLNAWLGGPQSNRAVPLPAYSRAVGISAATLLVFLFVNGVLRVWPPPGAPVSPNSPATIFEWLRPLSFPLVGLFTTLLNWRFLPTTLLRALGVTVFGFLILVMLLWSTILCVFASRA